MSRPRPTLVAITLTAAACGFAASASVARARPATPVVAPPASAYDDRPIRAAARTDGSTVREAADGSTSADPPPSATGSGIDLWRLGLSLGAVVGVILLLKGVAGKWLGATGTASAGRAVRVVSRTTIGPRQQVVVLQVGRRVVVACDSAGRVTTLSEITDADEVASILGTSAGAPASPDADLLDGPADPADSASRFGSWLAGSRAAFAPSGDGEAASGGRSRRDDPDAGEELDGLADRVRTLTAQFRRE